MLIDPLNDNHLSDIYTALIEDGVSVEIKCEVCSQFQVRYNYDSKGHICYDSNYATKIYHSGNMH